MFQCLLAFFNEVVSFSTASMASSNVSLVHLLLVIKGLHLLTFFCFLLVLVQKMVGHSPCFDLASLVIHFTSYEAHSTPLSTSPWPLLPTCWWCVIQPYKRYKLEFFHILPSSQENMIGQGMSKMHVSNQQEEVINAQNCSKSSQIKLWSIVSM